MLTDLPDGTLYHWIQTPGWVLDFLLSWIHPQQETPGGGGGGGGGGGTLTLPQLTA